MTKKLFVVLVVIAAMLVCVTIVTAKNRVSPSSKIDATVLVPKTPQFGYDKLTDPRIHKVSDMPMPAGKAAPLVTAEGPTCPNLVIPPGYGATPQVYVEGKPDTCLVLTNSAPPSYYYTGWLAGNEAYAQFADAEDFCSPPVYPFGITNLYYHVYARTGNPSVTGFFMIAKADMSDPSCPVPGPVIWTSATYVWGPLPYGYIYRLGLSLDAQVCVNGPYFVEFYHVGPTSTPTGDTLEVVSDQTADDCQSYNDWGSGWYDLVVDVGFSGNLRLYSSGLSYVDAYNTCPAIPTCDYMRWNDGNPYWYYGGYTAGAVFFTSTRTGYLGKARIMFSATGSSGTPEAWFYLWDGDNTSGPGNKIDSIYVPNSDILYDPAWTEVDWTSHNIPINAGDNIFFGYEPVRPDTLDELAWLADYNGDGATYHSWLDDGSGWMSEYDYYGDYSEYMMELEVCGEAPCDTVTANLADYLGPAYIWAFPSTSSRDYTNERFSVPYTFGGRLDQIRILFYDKRGTPSPTVYLWLDDGTGLPLDAAPPSNAVASWTIAPGDVMLYPDWQVVNTWDAGIYFTPGEQFHVGYSFPNNGVDSLSLLSDDYNDASNTSDRASWWWPGGYWENVYDHYGIHMSWVMEATLCVTAPPESTFVLTVDPNVGYISPGDANIHVYDVSLISVVGYNLPVTMDIVPATLPAGVTYSYVPGSVTPPGSSELHISADMTVPYGTYTLTLRGTGSDSQVKTVNVNLVVQMPFDEGVVNFFHGKQRSSNFGMIANDALKPNFEWYGADPLFAGTIVSAMTWPVYDEEEDHMQLVYGGCDYPFSPTQHMIITHEPWCPASTYEENYGEVAYSNFYTEETRIPGEYDSLFIIGLADVPSTDFSIKIKIYYNPTTNMIPQLWAALYEDWDVGSTDWGDMDTLHNIMWQYDSTIPDIVFGAMDAPFYDEVENSMVFLYHQQEVYPTTADSCFQCGDATPPQPGGKYLYKLMSQHDYRPMGYWGEGPDDHSILLSGQPFSLNPGEQHVKIWVDFGRNLQDGFTWEQWYHRILRYVGFYRGDVNASDTLELPALDVSDLVYLINYLYQGGPAPQPFIDQGNVDGKGPYGGPIDTVCPKNNVDVQDLVYLVNYVFKNGPAPVDYVRFIPSFHWRTSLFESTNW